MKLLLLAILPLLASGEGTQIVGWRGDGTGRFPAADPPLTWERKCTSPVATLCFQAKKPASASIGDARPLPGGFVPEWLVLGPLTAQADPPADADEGEKSGELVWKLHQQQAIEDIARRDKWAPWNPGNDIDFVNLKHPSFALTHVFSERPGAVTILVNHVGGLKAWVNGAAVYGHPDTAVNLTVFSGTNRSMNAEIPFPPPAPRFDVVLRKGWNVLAFKAAGRFNLRFTAPAGAKYETKNIRWTTRMPAWSNGSPIVVRDRVFVTSEPDELVCVSAKDGRILWRRSNTFVEALPPAERAAFAAAEPLVAQLATAEGEDEIWGVRRRIYEILRKADPKKYALLGDHTPAHGFTTPTPVSDGSHVYVLFGHGVAACYDLDGNRRWIKSLLDLGSNRCFNVSSPVLVEGKFVIFRSFIRALDAKTGATAWTTGELTQERDMDHGGGRADNWPQSMNVVRVGGAACIYMPGKIVRIADGKVLLARKTPGHWTSPVLSGDSVFDLPDGTLVRMTLKTSGPEEVSLVDEQQAAGCGDLTFSSPLVHDGIAYGVDCKGVMAAFEAGEKGPLRRLYAQDFGVKPIFHYNSNGVSASVALGGRHVFFFDDQGTCVVVEPGKAYREVARNRIEEFMQRRYAVNPREIGTRSSPFFAGSALYVRSEQNLYCIGR